MEKVKACCLALAQEALKPPSLFNPHDSKIIICLQKLLEALEGQKQHITPTVAEYVFFPIRGLLQQNSLGDRQTEYVFIVISFLCKFAWSERGLELERARQLISVVTFLLSPDPPLNPETAGNRNVFSEFFKKHSSYRAAGLECISQLYRVASHCGFVDELNRSPATVQIISLLLEALNLNTDDLSAQLIYLEGLRCILANLKAEHIALVLPSVASKLTLLARVPSKRHFKVKVSAIDCLKHTIVDCVGDESWQADIDFGKTIRTQEWLQTTAEKLSDSFHLILMLQVASQEHNGSRPELPHAIFNFARDIYENCQNTLSPFEEPMERLTQMMLLATSQSQDASLADTALEFLRVTPTIKTPLENGFLKHLRQLPSVINSANESRAVTLLNSIASSLSILDPSETVGSFLDAVESSISVSLPKRDAINELPDNAFLASLSLQSYEKNKYLYLSDLGLRVSMGRTTQAALVSALRILGQLNPEPVLSSLCERLQVLKLRSPRSLDGVTLLWITACVLGGANAEIDLHDIVTYCFEDLLKAMEMQAGEYSAQSVITPAHLTLACYVIGEAALVQKEGFEEYLVDLVHPLFTVLGGMSSQSIREQAGCAISKIALACGYSSPMALALENKDYLIDGIALQLNTLNLTPSTLQALATLIYISGASIVPYLDDVVASLFVLMDHYHGYSRLVTGILSVFRALIFVVDKQVGPKLKRAIAQEPEQHPILTDFESLVKELERKPHVDSSILDEKVDLNKWAHELAAKKERSERFREADSDDEVDALSGNGDESDESDTNSPDRAESAVEAWEYPVAKSIYTMLERISDYCDRLMTHESAEIRVATLHLVSIQIPYLSVNREKFLPLVHRTWPEAIARTADSEIYVVEQSFACLGAITQNAQDFVESRIENAWPDLLKQYAPMLTKKWPEYSAEKRKITAFARFFIVMIESISDLSLSVLEPAIVAFRPALLRGEYTQLKNALQRARASVGDLLWLVLLEQTLDPPSTNFRKIEPAYKTRSIPSS